MEWYLPLTIIPGIGLIILSTSNIMLALNTEISQLKNREPLATEIIHLKVKQLKRLSRSIVFQYLGVLLFLFSGIVKSIFSLSPRLPGGLLLAGVVAITVSISMLLVYSTKAVHIRIAHLS